MNVRKKAISSMAVLALAAGILVGGLSGCGSTQTDLTTVKLSEVTHSVFYAPQYVAMELGFFEEEGLAIELTSGEGADKVMTSVISGAVDIGFSGPEAAIYIYNEGREDYAVVFAQVTQRDGSFLIGREPSPDFKWEDIEGAHMLPGRKGGVPYMTLEYVVKQHGLTPGVDVEFDNSVQYAAMTGAFIGGTGDYVTAFEPTASTLEKEGKGYVLASVGESSGEIPYTAYYATKSYIEDHPDTIQSFSNAIAKAQKWVEEHTAAQVAETVASSFPDADLEILTSAIQRYKDIEAYAEVPAMSEEAFDRLQLVMEEAGELAQKAPYKEIVDNSFALEAAVTK